MGSLNRKGAPEFLRLVLFGMPRGLAEVGFNLDGWSRGYDEDSVYRAAVWNDPFHEAERHAAIANRLFSASRGTRRN